MSAEYFEYPVIDPIVFSWGPLTGNWYGLFYELGFLTVSFLFLRTVRKNNNFLNKERAQTLILSCFVCLLIGSRLGYVLSYCPKTLINDPLYVIKFWDGCGSFAGSLIALIIMLSIFSKKWGVNMLRLSDMLVSVAPLAVLAALVGDVVTGVGWGQVSLHSLFSTLFASSHPDDLLIMHTQPEYWDVMKDNKYGVLPRYPTQVYDVISALLTFIVLRVIIFRKPKQTGLVSAIFLISHTAFKIVIEMFRVPDTIISYMPQYSVTIVMLQAAVIFLLSIVFLLTLKFKEIYSPNLMREVK